MTQAETATTITRKVLMRFLVMDAPLNLVVPASCTRQLYLSHKFFGQGYSSVIFNYYSFWCLVCSSRLKVAGLFALKNFQAIQRVIQADEQQSTSILSCPLLFPDFFFQHYGKEIIAKEVQLDEGHPDVHLLFLTVYNNFIEVIINCIL